MGTGGGLRDGGWGLGESWVQLGGMHCAGGCGWGIDWRDGARGGQRLWVSRVSSLLWGRERMRPSGGMFPEATVSAVEGLRPDLCIGMSGGSARCPVLVHLGCRDKELHTGGLEQRTHFLSSGV